MELRGCVRLQICSDLCWVSVVNDLAAYTSDTEKGHGKGDLDTPLGRVVLD